ncbi:GroES-like protein [Glarea lozoyensis ATCC 20868]|uniref:GroES-like protein n=1 Tax=Glarea lozoyensis (strain ATCC 20868 / MF5171) TaxID=1116229 RepID=S3CQE1_GLAL2|nr:GroES-like protein [Glarea lozoyensis ATCC 20868]EPE28682.1 GroES-like protein [Glarea lozoyensis ATCC 20868]
MPPSNTAAWITAEKANPLELKPAPYVQPAANQIVIKNLAVALNLVDWSRQDLGASLFGWTKYPAIFGSDVSGTVEKVGSSVTRLKLGDRVVAHADETTNNDPSQGAFQNYVVVDSHMASRIPDSLSYESASVIPLCVSTAACALFQKDTLALQFPSSPPKPPTGKTLLVWSGASGVGSNAIQLATAAGYEVVTTCSPKNNDFVKSIGATLAFDYNSPTIVFDLISALKDKTMAGGFAVGNGSPTPVIEIISKLNGTKFVASANPNIGSPPPDDIGFKFVFGTSLRENEVGPAIYENFLTKALADGTFLAKPDADVVGHGLSDIQKGLDILKKGVSAKKIVISLA